VTSGHDILIDYGFLSLRAQAEVLAEGQRLNDHLFSLAAAAQDGLNRVGGPNRIWQWSGGISFITADDRCECFDVCMPGRNRSIHLRAGDEIRLC
jgi:hypothetical protein